MKLGTAIVLLLAAALFFLASYLHDAAHRYDVVVAAAGSGGSQDQIGSTEVKGYLVDHKNGRVWVLRSDGQVPVRVMNCSYYQGGTKETERGCEDLAPPPPKP
jgi:hypothetical protein